MNPRFSGVVASYPGLKFNIEGHTDSVGNVGTNSELSLQRARFETTSSGRA